MKTNTYPVFIPLFGVVAFLAMLLSPALAAELNESLVLYYPFNNTAEDQSGNALHGKISNILPATDRFGRENGALFFNGSNSIVSLPNSKTINFQEDFTITLWMRRSNTIGKNSDILYQGSSESPASIRLGLNKANALFAGNENANGETNTINGYTRLPYRWLHIALVHTKGHSLKLYLNAAIVGKNTQIQTNPVSVKQEYPISIGMQDMESAFVGSIDDFRIYNKPLTESEIISVYTSEWVRAESYFQIKKQAGYGGHTYLVSRRIMPIVQAKTLAAMYGGYLAIPDNAQENSFLKTLAGGVDYWLGIQRGDNDDANFYRQNDLQKVAWSRWYSGEPNNGITANWRSLPAEWYVETYGNEGSWNDVSDSYKAVELGGDLAIVEIDKEIDALTDTDQDGLPDCIELNYYKTSPISTDTDGDGFNDNIEVSGGYKPTDSSSRPESIAIETAIELIFWANDGDRYQLQNSKDLSTWVDFPFEIVGEGSEIRKLVSVDTNEKLYWRLKKIP